MTRYHLFRWQDAVCAADSPLSSTERLVAFSVSRFANSEGVAFPALKTVAASAAVSDRTVRAAMRALEEAGFVRVESRGGVRGGTLTTVYNLTMPVDNSHNTVDNHVENPGTTFRPPETETPTPENTDSNPGTTFRQTTINDINDPPKPPDTKNVVPIQSREGEIQKLVDWVTAHEADTSKTVIHNRARWRKAAERTLRADPERMARINALIDNYRPPPRTTAIAFIQGETSQNLNNYRKRESA